MSLRISIPVSLVLTSLMVPAAWATTPLDCTSDEDCPSQDCEILDGEEMGVCNEPPPSNDWECSSDEDCDEGEVCIELPTLSDGTTRRVCDSADSPSAQDEDTDLIEEPDSTDPTESSDDAEAGSSGCHGGPQTSLGWMALCLLFILGRRRVVT